MQNYRFNIDEWLPRFPLDLNTDRYRADIITGPSHICNNELLRKEMQDQYIWGPSVPMDIFVMAEGEPPDRHVTKVGGLPYRPSRAKWPTTRNGNPMLFLAQFNFSDSVDITGDLPGDVLLVFSDESFESLGFEWRRLGLSDLMAAEAVPSQKGEFDPCYGHIFRTVSYPEGDTVLPYKQQRYPLCRGREVWSDYFLLRYQAMQIGSAPFFIQGDPELPGRMLCTINSVQPNQHAIFPWINHPEPLMPENEWSHDNNYLMIGDMGCIYVSIDEHHQLHWNKSCF